MPIALYAGDKTRWEPDHVGEATFYFPEAKAILCKEIGTQKEQHIIIYNGDVIKIDCIGNGIQQIEFTKGGVRYIVNEIILRGEKEYFKQNKTLAYIERCRVENFLPCWFEANK